MKNIILLFIAFFYLGFSSRAAAKVKTSNIGEIKCDTLPQTDPVYQYLKNVNLGYFLTRPIDSFLVSINRFADSMHVSSCGSTKEGLYLACYLQVEYGTSPVKDFTIRFYVKNYTHMNRYDGNRIWNATLMKQEIPTKIEIYYLWDKMRSVSL